MKGSVVKCLFLVTIFILVKDAWEVRGDLASLGTCVGANCKQHKGKKKYKILDLSYQNLLEVPTSILEEHADTLEVLNLSENKITKIKLGDFPYMPKLHTLQLQKNQISTIVESSLDFLGDLMVLRLEDNFLTKIPKFNMALQLYELDISYNRITEINSKDLEFLTLLKTLIMRGNKITFLKDGTFKFNPKMTEIDLSENPLTLMEPDSLVGPEKLETLFLQATKISKLPDKGLKYLHRLKINEIEEMWTVPEPSAFEQLEEVDVTYSVHCCPFRGLHAAEKVDDAMPCSEYLARQKAKTSKPSPTQKTQTLDDFLDWNWDLSGDLDDSGDGASIQTNQTDKNDDQSMMHKVPRSSPLQFPPSDDDLDDPFKDIIASFKRSNATARPLCSQLNSTIKYVPPSRRVKCRPKPDAFNPCDDVIGTTLLRVFSWASSMLAIFGNVFLLIVLYCNESPLNVYKLLMYNLGIANAIMGFYLAILCSLDTFTYGKYYNFVRAWQYSGGCKVTGFLAVFSTELSVCVLAIVTIERYLLIIHALHIRRQMKLIHAKIALTIAWTYSFVVAILPVTDVISSYQKVAICLPFEASTTVSKGYVFWLLLFYLVTFLFVVLAYWRMYVSVNGAPPCAGVNTEFKVAKRFSMIVFCNFGCWIPISIAGFLAFFSKLSMSIDISKFLLVFAFPLNACTNPFLYAFFTSIFRGDVINLLRKLGIMKKSSVKFHQRNQSYTRGRKGSRASEGTVSTSACNSRFSPPGAVKSGTAGNTKNLNNARRINTSPVTFANPKSPPECYRSLSNEAGDHIMSAKRQQQSERRRGFHAILDGLWAITVGRRNRNESTSSNNELLSSYDPERFSRIRSVSEAVEIACHSERLVDVGQDYDIEGNSPPTDITNL